MGSNRNALTRAQVIDAAEACFHRYGIHRTSMTDIAATLGVARQTLYRVFETRGELLADLAGRRIAVLGEMLKPHFARFATLEEALIDGSVISIRAGAGDAMLSEILRHGDDHSFEQFLFKGSPEIQAIMLELWSPLIDEARARGHIRAGRTDEAIVEWIRNTHAMLTIRHDYGEAELRDVLHRFFLPSIMTDR